MTDRITIAVHKGVVSEVVIPDDADVEVEVIDFDTDDQDNNSELHRNPVGYKVLYQLSTEDVRSMAEQAVDYGDDEIGEEQMEFILGGGLKIVEKAIDAGMQDWDSDIRIGIEEALGEFNKKEVPAKDAIKNIA